MKKTRYMKKTSVNKTQRLAKMRRRKFMKGGLKTHINDEYIDVEGDPEAKEEYLINDNGNNNGNNNDNNNGNGYLQIDQADPELSELAKYNKDLSNPPVYEKETKTINGTLSELMSEIYTTLIDALSPKGVEYTNTANKKYNTDTGIVEGWEPGYEYRYFVIRNINVQVRTKEFNIEFNPDYNYDIFFNSLDNFFRKISNYKKKPQTFIITYDRFSTLCNDDNTLGLYCSRYMYENLNQIFEYIATELKLKKFVLHDVTDQINKNKDLIKNIEG